MDQFYKINILSKLLMSELKNAEAAVFHAIIPQIHTFSLRSIASHSGMSTILSLLFLPNSCIWNPKIHRIPLFSIVSTSPSALMPDLL